MNIKFHQVTPSPLDGVTDVYTQIWQREVEFNCSKRYIIAAPSGRGKSTFIHLIYGLRKDFRGQISIDEKNINDISAHQWAEIRQNKLSIVFQDLRLFSDLTPMENILLKVKLGAFTSMQKIEEYFEQLNICHLKNKPCKYLSYGERQRVAILRALVQPFECLLLDEPFSHLDSKNAECASSIISAECTVRNAGFIITSLGNALPLSAEIEYIL
ncbi:MAG: ATP-binding cassette domain-containing protein [Cytophagaceae bacterium]|nr:ATP-binding cassette domain-containing protein [Cytophagaceae bacterium]MDW8455536.1 ATP-binding cassette domain-containing protein [Cytophagaceae bacterium]